MKILQAIGWLVWFQMTQVVKETGYHKLGRLSGKGDNFCDFLFALL